jgi:hypothetical protein
MNQRLPEPVISKSKSQMAEEYGLDIRQFNNKLKHVNIVLPPGRILPREQMNIYEALVHPSVSISHQV